MQKLSIGSIGEAVAKNFLLKKKYSVLTQNFRIRNGEIDIIALDPTKKILVFVEVKTRTSIQFGTPLEAITPWKLHFIERAAEYYKHTHKSLPDEMRIDAISILLGRNDKITEIEHIENVSGY